MQDPRAELSRLGLARYRSAPTTWLDALLEEDEHEHELKPPSSLTQLLTESNPTGNFIHPTTPDHGVYAGGGGGGFSRMNSSPADFLGGSMDGYLPGFGIPSSAGPDSRSSFDYGGTSVSPSCPGPGPGPGPGGKRVREGEFDDTSPKFASQRRGELTTANSLVEMEMEKLLEDSVACRVRAKRGCATHPRSIAERVRRTRISDRIRKLQDLVPNMDKQTNTADMLEEAVEYVKTLQRQIQELTEQQKNCRCLPRS